MQSRRELLLRSMAAGALLGMAPRGAAALETPPDGGCYMPLDALYLGLSAWTYPVWGPVMLFSPWGDRPEEEFLPNGLAGFHFNGDDGTIVETEVEAYPNLPKPARSYWWPSRQYRLRPRTPMRPGVRYTIVALGPTGPLVKLPIARWARVTFDVREGWRRPPPRGFQTLRTRVVDSPLDECGGGRRILIIENQWENTWTKREVTRWQPRCEVFEVWVSRYPAEIDYNSKPQFLTAQYMGSGSISFDGGRVGGPLDVFLPRYAAKIGFREIDAAGQVSKPIELYLPEAVETSPLGEFAWEPFGH